MWLEAGMDGMVGLAELRSCMRSRRLWDSLAGMLACLRHGADRDRRCLEMDV